MGVLVDILKLNPANAISPPSQRMVPSGFPSFRMDLLAGLFRSPLFKLDFSSSLKVTPFPDSFVLFFLTQFFLSTSP